ncbi:hypothetical protein [Niastella vici]|nr:hypothetical protein [Niastella vici]
MQAKSRAHLSTAWPLPQKLQIVNNSGTKKRNPGQTGITLTYVNTFY